MKPSSPATAEDEFYIVDLLGSRAEALDGTVLVGKSYLDMSKLTGEFIPRQVEEGSQVLSGTINGIGLIVARVDKPYGMSTAARIMRSVEQAEERKAVPERFIRRFARYYTPAVFAIAALIAVLPPLLGAGAFEDWAKRALVMLVMSCPCALVISVPLAYFAGMGRISRYGVLVKGAAFVDVLAGLDTVVFDKTGTLTKGRPELTDLIERGEAFALSTVVRTWSSSPRPVSTSPRSALRTTRTGGRRSPPAAGSPPSRPPGWRCRRRKRVRSPRRG